jgi:hypothetical protein
MARISPYFFDAIDTCCWALLVRVFGRILKFGKLDVEIMGGSSDGMRAGSFPVPSDLA